MKKIAFVLNGLITGGIEKALVEILKHLKSLDVDTTVIALRCGGDFENEIKKYSKVKFVPKMTTTKEDMKEMLKHLRLIRFFKCVAEKVIISLKYSRLEKYELFSSRVPKDVEEFDIAVAFHMPYSLPVVYTLNNIKASKKVAWIHYDISALIKVESDFTEKYVGFDKIICVSKAVKKEFLKHHLQLAEKTHVIYNIVDENVVRILSCENTGLKKMEGETIICTVGRLDADKGYDIALDACRLLLSQGYNVKWYVIGDGIKRKEIEKQIEVYNLKDYFVLLGNQQNPYKYMEFADIYVQTSKTESYCLTLAEAKVIKKAIITTDFPCAKEHIEDGRNGIIVEKTAESVSKAIKRLIDNRELRCSLIENVCYDTNEQTKEKLNMLFDI